MSLLRPLAFASFLVLLATGRSFAVDQTFDVSADGTTGSVFDGLGTNPTLALERGRTYQFNEPSAATHPFYLKTSLANGGTNDVYSDGVSGNGTTTVLFTVPESSPDTLYYQCAFHLGQEGIIQIGQLFADGFESGTLCAWSSEPCNE